MNFHEAIDHILAGGTVTDGFLKYRIGRRFLECKQGYLGWKPQCPYWTREQLESTQWELCAPDDPSSHPQKKRKHSTTERNDP